MVLAHSLVGVPITYFLLNKTPESVKKKISINFAYFIGIVGAVFPDFDLTLRFFIHDLDHRRLVSHSIIPYLILFITLILISKIFKKEKENLKVYTMIFFISVLSHLLLDFLVGGISLFAPFVSVVYGIDIYFEKGSEFFYQYFTSWYMFFESIIILFSSYYIYKLRTNLVILGFPLFLFCIALIMSMSY